MGNMFAKLTRRRKNGKKPQNNNPNDNEMNYLSEDRQQRVREFVEEVSRTYKYDEMEESISLCDTNKKRLTPAKVFQQTSLHEFPNGTNMKDIIENKCEYKMFIENRLTEDIIQRGPVYYGLYEELNVKQIVKLLQHYGIYYGNANNIFHVVDSQIVFKHRIRNNQSRI
jgi:hypothetical protein